MTGRGRGNRGRGDRGGNQNRGPGARDAYHHSGGGDRGGFSSRGRGAPVGRQGAPGPGRGGKGPVTVYSQDNSVPPPSAKVTRTEDLFQESLSSGKGLGALKIDDNFPSRPGYGTRGEQVTLWANYFEMIPSPDLILYRYSVDIVPEAKGKKLGQVIKLLILDYPEFNDFKDDIVTDFKANFFSRRALNLSSEEYRITYRPEGVDKESIEERLRDEARDRAQTFKAAVKEIGTLTVSTLTDYLTSTNTSMAYANKLPVLQALNIFLGHYAKSSPAISTVGSTKSFFHTQAERWDLGAGLTALRGFFSSVRAATCRILVNVNVTHGAFYNAIRLDDLITNYDKNNASKRANLQVFLRFVRVETTHLEKKFNKAGEPIIRVRTISGLAKPGDGRNEDHPPRVQYLGAGSKDVEFFFVPPSDSSTHQAAGGPASKNLGMSKNVPQGAKYISVYDHFRKHYPKIAMNPAMPVVNVGNQAFPSYLPAEACLVMPGQNSRRKLSPAQTQEMIRFAVREPYRNAESITRHGLGTAGLLPQSNSKLGRFGVSVTQSLITVPGRVLAAPRIEYRQNKTATPWNGKWNMKAIRFNTGAVLHDWTYWLISWPGQAPDAWDSSRTPRPEVLAFYNILQETGINAPRLPTQGKMITIKDADDPQIETELKNVSGDSKYPKLVLVILPTADTLLYNRIKRAGDVRYGVHTVCVVASKFITSKPQYFANVALKVNLKLGGVNQMVQSSKLGIINEDKTMVVGLDVTHPSPGSTNNAPSVAGMVASVDRYLGQWPADLRIQDGRKEMVTDLEPMLESRLHLWRRLGKHQSYPENILVYRDGVSEGQYKTVLEQELPLLRKACAKVYPASDTKKGLPRMTIIIVGKRHHTRFYPTAAGDADDSSNPRNGTVVDRGVTEARNWDFFLQSHTALHGTARPAHYYIVLNEIFGKRHAKSGLQNVADVLEELTHNMCYLFGRATTAVSICPPAYYADLVCERARRYLVDIYDEMSAQSDDGGAVNRAASSEDVAIHPKLRDTMFYI